MGLNKVREKLPKKTKIMIAAIIGAVLFLTFGSFKENKTQEITAEDKFDFKEYKNSLTSETEEALSKIKGAGKVKVVLNFDSRGRTVVAKNSQSKVQTDKGTNDTSETKENTDSVVVYGQGQNETPYITEEKLPIPTGVLVIADGAGNENVRTELYEAVKALYGISSHRIKIAGFKK